MYNQFFYEKQTSEYGSMGFCVFFFTKSNLSQNILMILVLIGIFLASSLRGK